MTCPRDPDSEDEAERAALFDFLDEWHADPAAPARPLAEWLARYPAQQQAIAREYLRLCGAAVERAREVERTTDPGARHVGPYRLLEELGRGGQGEVFLAEDTRIARRVALKLVGRAFVTTDRRRRLRREAEIIARLDHPGICAVHDAEVEGEAPYIAMRHVEGESLAGALARARQPRGGVPPILPIPPRDELEVHRVLRFFERAARALHAAHEAGVVHRDVKPGNLMVTPRGEPVVLDFGMAHDHSVAAAALTRTGELFGTPAYMSPEQLDPSRGALDRRTDVYSLGVTLYEALTAVRAFAQESRLELERAILGREPADPRRHNPVLGQDVAVVLATSIAKERGARYATALELAEDLRRICEYEPIRARPAGVLLHLRRWVRREPRLAASMIGTILVLAGALAVSLALLERVREASQRTERALEFSTGRHLASRALENLDRDPGLALALAIEAAETAPTYQTRSALFRALDACALERVLRCAGANRFADLELAAAPGGSLLAGALDDGSARLWRLPAGTEELVLSHAGERVRRASLHGTRWLATGTEAGRVTLWELPEGREHARRDGGGVPVLWLEFDSAGTRLVALSADGRARVLALPQLEPLFELELAPGSAGSARFDPRGERILTASLGWQPEPRTASDTPMLWDARTGLPVAHLQGHRGAVQWSEFARDGERLVTAATDGSARLWSARDGTPLGEPLVHPGELACATFSPDGRFLACTAATGPGPRAWVWDLESGERRELGGHEESPVLHAAFSPDGSLLATCGLDLATLLFEVPSFRQRSAFRALFLPLESLWTPDSRRIVSLSNSAGAHVWSLGELPYAFRLRGHGAPVVRARFAPDGTRALTASADGSLRLWSTPAGGGAAAPGACLAVFTGHRGAVRGAYFVAAGEELLSHGEDGTLRRWDAASGEPLGAPLEHGAGVRSLVLDAQEERAATLDDAGAVRIWDRAGGAIAVDTSQALVGCIDLSRDGALLAAGGSDRWAAVHDARSGRLVARLDAQTPSPRSGQPEGWRVNDIALRPDGGEVALACSDMRLRFRDPQSGAPTRPDLHLFEPLRLQYTRDGLRLLVLGERPGSLHLYDLSSEPPTHVGPRELHARNLTHAELSRDDRWVLSTSRDGSIYVWDARDGNPLAHRTGEWGAVLHASFSPADGDLRVVSAASDGTAAVWPVDPLPAAKARQPRELAVWEIERERELAGALPGR